MAKEKKTAVELAGLDERAGDFTKDAEAQRQKIISGAADAPAAASTSGRMGVKFKFEDEVDIKEIIANVERLKAEVGALKDIKFQADARVRELAESLGEVRSLFFQRDTTARELEANVARLSEEVKSVNPRTLTEELAKRERDAEEQRARLEKVELLMQDFATQVREAQRGLGKLSSAANLLEVDKDIDQKIARMEEMRSSVERLSSKVEKIFFELDRRLTEFRIAKDKVEKVDELTKELMKSMDETKVKLTDVPSREEVDKLQAAIKLARETKPEAVIPVREINDLRAEIEALKSRFQATVDSVRVEPTELPSAETADVVELEKHRHEVKDLLALLEEEYRDGLISEKTFNETRQKNEDRLLQIEIKLKKLNEVPQSVVQAPRPVAPAPVTEEMPAPAPVIEKVPDKVPEKPKLKVELPIRKLPSLNSAEDLVNYPETPDTLTERRGELMRFLELMSEQQKKGLISEERYFEILSKTSAQVAEYDTLLDKINKFVQLLPKYKKEQDTVEREMKDVQQIVELLQKQHENKVITVELFVATKGDTQKRIDSLQSRLDTLSKIIGKLERTTHG